MLFKNQYFFLGYYLSRHFKTTNCQHMLETNGAISVTFAVLHSPQRKGILLRSIESLTPVRTN